ncbi:hypothetical protein [Pseudomonas purpurea]|uniref:hypothetical protein n=1 Tax=Pseudomonas purpurea TaxID=3136737 RepID=UPI003266C95E
MIDLGYLHGTVTFNDLSTLDNVDVQDQLDALKEDLLQVQYPQNLLIDVGWYPEFCADGAFRVYVIQHEQWHSPCAQIHANSLQTLEQGLREAQATVERIIGNADHGTPPWTP